MKTGNTARRAGIALALMAIGACTSEVSAPSAADALASDSTLKHEILLANQAAALADAKSRDTTIAKVEVVEEELPRVPTAEEIRAILEPPAPPPPPTAERASMGPAVVIARPTPAPRRATAPARPRQTTPVRTTAESVSTTAESASVPVIVEPEPTRLVTVPAGTDLILESGRRICVNTNRVGDRFSARLTRSAAGIPSGSRATLRITSLTGSLGEEDIVLDVTSVNVDGETQSVAARVRNIELDRSPGAYRCIPDGGRITAELTRALRVER